jgi:putative ABC transport system ATP-binding protein
MLEYVEPQLRMGLVDDELREKILAARKRFKEGLPQDLSDAISFYDPATYNAAASVQDNLLMGRISYGIARGPQRVLDALSDLLSQMDLRYEVLKIGLEFDIGTAGKRLTTVQRQKIGLARALVKQPDLLVLNRPLSSMDTRQQEEIIHSVMDYAGQQENPPAIVWVLSDANLSAQFDDIYVMSGGKIVETGKRRELLEAKGEFAKLVAE